MAIVHRPVVVGVVVVVVVAIARRKTTQERCSGWKSPCSTIIPSSSVITIVSGTGVGLLVVIMKNHLVLFLVLLCLVYLLNDGLRRLFRWLVESSDVMVLVSLMWSQFTFWCCWKNRIRGEKIRCKLTYSILLKFEFLFFMSFSKLFLCPLVGMILVQYFFDIVSFVVTDFMVSFVLTRYGSKLGICPCFGSG